MDDLNIQPVNQAIQPTNVATQILQSSQNSINQLWNVSPGALQQAVKVANALRTTHGMLAAVPILCKEKDCPFVSSCMIDPQYRIVGQRCPQEIGAIVSRFETWCKHFGIELSNTTIKDEDITDASLVRDLVDLEIQTLRAENRVAQSGDFIARTISTVDSKGRAYYEDVVSPEAEFNLTLFDKRHKILNHLNATRKDKANMAKRGDNPSVKAVSIFKTISEKLGGALDDLENQQLVEDTSTVSTTTAINVEFEKGSE